MSDDNYLDIFEDESVRVTTFRRLEIPDSISDVHGELNIITSRKLAKKT